MAPPRIIVERVEAFERVLVVSATALFFKCFGELLVGDHCVDLLGSLLLLLMTPVFLTLDRAGGEQRWIGNSGRRGRGLLLSSIFADLLFDILDSLFSERVESRALLLVLL